MTNVNAKLPQDANNNPFNRAMGIPLCCNNKIVGSPDYFRDMIDFPVGRVFNGIMIENTSSSARLQIAIGDDFANQVCMDILPQGLVTFDQQTFGSFQDESADIAMSTKLRAKLSVLAGVLATGDITYSGQPTNGESFTMNGIVYEFSSDASVVPGRIKIDIGGSANATYDNLVTVVNDSDPNVVAVRALTVVTFTSSYGGTDGNAMTLTGSVTNAVLTGFSGGSGGVTPIIHIW